MDQKFGEFIREKRLQKGYKLKTFAKLVGISAVYESYIENGKRPAPARLILESMAKVLELSSAESAELRRLAAATHSKCDLPQDVVEYLADRQYLIDIIRSAEAKNLSEDGWNAVMDLIGSGEINSSFE